MSALRATEGFTLIELLVAMASGMVVTLAAVYFLIFTGEDVSHITARVNVDQTARVAMQQVVSELHSACLGPNVIPIQKGSSETVLKFVSETGEKSSFSTVNLHEIIYTPASGSTEGTLVEKTYPSTGGSTAPNYTWSSTATTTKLLTGIRKTKYGSEETPVFRYYRYYQNGDTPPTGLTEVPYGEINPTPIKEVKETSEAEDITKVTIAFTIQPEGKEAVSFNHDRPVPLEDSAVFRLAPSSESSSNPNLPCTEKT